MKTFYIIAAVSLAISCKTPVKRIMTLPETPIAQVSLLSETTGLSHAESVIYDENYNRLYVSVQGEQEPGDGGIVTMDLEGNIINKRFTTGLNNPKGLAILGDWIYVSDVTELVGINRQTGEILKRYPVGDEHFLNDVTVDDDNNVYVSDMRTSSIYQLKGSSKLIKWISSPLLENPNGLLALNNTIYVAAWGLPSKVEGQNSKGRFIKVDINSKKIENITVDPQGNLDGVQVFDDNHFLISDWRAGTISIAAKNGSFKPFFRSEMSVGDILYIRDKQLLALPLNRQNKVLIYKVNQ